MTDQELIAYTVKETLKQLGYKARNEQQWISQSAALRLLKPKNIGRAKLNRYMVSGTVRFFKDNMSIRNSSVSVNREDIFKLLNR